MILGVTLLEIVAIPRYNIEMRSIVFPLCF